MRALKHTVQFVLHTVLGAALRACPSSPGNAWPCVAQALNVHVVRVGAQIDQLDELVVWNMVSSNAWCTGPGITLLWQVCGKVVVVGTQGDIRARGSAWVAVQVPPNNNMLVFAPHTHAFLNVHPTIRLQCVCWQLTAIAML